MPDGRILSVLELTPRQVADMTELDYRKTILRHEEPLTEPAIKAVENSMSRERNKIEDYFKPESGPEKWYKIGEQVLPRWAEVVSELHQREENALTSDIEPLYHRKLSTNLKRSTELHRRLEANPTETDIREFLQDFRGLENTYTELKTSNPEYV